jgi:hypothetical protein
MHGRRRIASAVVCTLPLALGLSACGVDSSGPEGSLARLAIRPVFGTAGGAAAAGIVDIARIRVRLVHENGTPEVDSVIVVEPGADSVTLEAQVRIASANEGFLLTVAFITPAGDTAFRGGPILIRPGPSSGAPVPIDLPIQYVGVGADAAGVRITSRQPTLLVRGRDTLVAEAFDDQNRPIPGTPIAWSSLDATATVPNPASGVVIGSGVGEARIVATLLTGPADTLATTVGGRVLVLSNYALGNQTIADSFPPFMTGLVFDTMDVTQQTPALAVLLEYPLLLLYEDVLFSNALNVGNVVAAYVQAGGNVVLGTFYWQDRSDNLVFAGEAASWGALEGLDPFFGPYGSEYREDSLYVPSIVAHPMTAGVDSLWVDSFHGGVRAKPGTTVLAHWSDACVLCEPDLRTPLLGYRIESGGQRIVGVSVAPHYPGYGRLRVRGNFYRLWANVLSWAIAGGSSSLGAGAAAVQADGARAHPAAADRRPRVGGSR